MAYDVLVIVQPAFTVSWAAGPLSLVSGRMGVNSECLVECAYKTIGAWCLLCVWMVYRQETGHLRWGKSFQPCPLKLKGNRGVIPHHPV